MFKLALNLRRFFGPNEQAEEIPFDVHSFKYDPNRSDNHMVFRELLAISKPPTIWISAMMGHKDEVKELLDRGVSPNVQNWQGVPPIMSAMYYGLRHEILELLLKAGADPNIERGTGFSPLHYAVDHADKKCVDLLLKWGADPNEVLASGGTLLGELLENDNLLMAARLMNAGGNYFLALRRMKDREFRRTFRREHTRLTEAAKEIHRRKVKVN